MRWPVRHLLVLSWRCSLRQWYISQGAFWAVTVNAVVDVGASQRQAHSEHQSHSSNTFFKPLFDTRQRWQSSIPLLLLSSNKWNLRFCFIAFSTCVYVYAPHWRDLESNMILIPDVSWGSRCCFTLLKLQSLSMLSAVREIKKCNYPLCCYSTVKCV